MPDWRHLVATCPGMLPNLMAHIVKAELTLELSLGRSKFLEALVSILARSYTFENPGLREAKYKVEELIEEGTKRKIWSANHQDEIDWMMAELQEKGAESFKLDQMEHHLHAGDFGWATKLPNSARGGLIEDAKQFYQKTFPEARKTTDNDDGELE